MKSHNPTWMRLDNAAKIYPAVRRKDWSALFRLSMTLHEAIEPDLLQAALEVTIKRFPSIAMHLKRGIFWYYLEQIKDTPKVKQDEAYPCPQDEHS